MEVLRLTGGETCTLTEDTNNKWTILLCYGPTKSSRSFFKACSLRGAVSILRSRTRHSLTSSHYCKSCITFSIALPCCSKHGKNSFQIVLYQYIRRYHLISKNGQRELYRDKISFNKLYLQRSSFQLPSFDMYISFPIYEDKQNGFMPNTCCIILNIDFL